MLPLTKVILPAAGLGTRFLPATKAMPKEMLPLVDKPLIQYAVEEACACDIFDIIVVTGRGKAAIEDHFDLNAELDLHLRRLSHSDVADHVRRIADMARIAYVRQHEPLGLGHAVMQAGYLIGNEAVAVMLADDVILSEVPCLSQLMDVYRCVGETVVALMEVPEDTVSSYGIAFASEVQIISGHKTVKISGLVEKPARGAVDSKLAVIGRYILHPEVFDLLPATPRGRNGEVQLTDALQALATSRGVYGVLFEGERFDAGSKLGFLQASIAVGLRREDIRSGLTVYLNRVSLRQSLGVGNAK